MFLLPINHALQLQLATATTKNNIFIGEKGGSKQELNSSVTSCDKARRGGKIH
jgi:hypothetical protein